MNYHDVYVYLYILYSCIVVYSKYIISDEETRGKQPLELPTASHDVFLT